MSIKISETARKAAGNCWHAIRHGESGTGDSEEIIQLAINEACKPLVEALEQLKAAPDLSVLLRLRERATNVLEAHRKEHGQ